VSRQNVELVRKAHEAFSRPDRDTFDVDAVNPSALSRRAIDSKSRLSRAGRSSS
jgi:hypothetical protein